MYVLDAYLLLYGFFSFSRTPAYVRYGSACVGGLGHNAILYGKFYLNMCTYLVKVSFCTNLYYIQLYKEEILSGNRACVFRHGLSLGKHTY